MNNWTNLHIRMLTNKVTLLNKNQQNTHFYINDLINYSVLV